MAIADVDDEYVGVAVVIRGARGSDLSPEQHEQMDERLTRELAFKLRRTRLEDAAAVSVPQLPLDARASQRSVRAIGRPRERRASRPSSSRSRGPDDPSDPEPPLNGRRCVVDGVALRGRQLTTCSDRCRKEKSRRDTGVRPRVRRPEPVTPPPSPAEPLELIRRRIAVAGALRHRLYVALPSANGNRAEIRSDIERLTERLNGSAHEHVVAVITDRNGRLVQLRDRDDGGLFAEARVARGTRR